MRISLLQPCIARGDIQGNVQSIQRLMDRSQGELLVLPEYALTGSLVLDPGADVRQWARETSIAEPNLRLPSGKYLLANSLVEIDSEIYNCCKLLPTAQRYCKQFPDETERRAGIRPGMGRGRFELLGKLFQVIICYDLPHVAQIPTDGIDFLVFVYHFTASNFARVIGEVKALSVERRLPVLASSLLSDANNGFCSFVSGETVVSLPDQEGILEVEL